MGFLTEGLHNTIAITYCQCVYMRHEIFILVIFRCILSVPWLRFHSSSQQLPCDTTLDTSPSAVTAVDNYIVVRKLCRSYSTENDSSPFHVQF